MFPDAAQFEPTLSTLSVDSSLPAAAACLQIAMNAV